MTMTDKEMHDLIAKAVEERTDGEAENIIDRHVDGYVRWSKTLKKRIYSSTAVFTVAILLFATSLHTIPLHTENGIMNYVVADIKPKNIYADVTTYCNISCSQREVVNMIKLFIK